MRNRWNGLRAAIVGVAVVTACGGSVVGASSDDELSWIVLDDFESGSLEGWRHAGRGAGAWYVYDDGNTPPNPSMTDRLDPFAMPDPPQGEFAAVTDTNKQGTRIMFRDVTLGGPLMLHLTVFFELGHGDNGRAASFSTPNSLDWWDDSLQFRIDLLDPSAPLDSVADDGVLVNVFSTEESDPATLAPTEVSVDLSDLAGQTVRLRLAEVAASARLRAGVDDIRFEPLAAGAGIEMPDLQSAQSTTEAPTAHGVADPVDIAERFMKARNAHDTATALSLLADPLDATALGLEVEQLYDVRYEPFACESSEAAGSVTCTYSMDSRLRRIEGLPPIESSFSVGVRDGLIVNVNFPWLVIEADPGGYWPVEFERFLHWLKFEHPDVHPPFTWPPEPSTPYGPAQLFYWQGQQLIHILTRDTVDLLAGYLDEYEQFLSTTGDSGLDDMATGFVGAEAGGVSVLVSHDGVTTTATAGVANAAGDPITPTTPFRVASITKTFVATMVLQLVDEGRVDLDAELSTYLPDTPVGGDVTIHALLSHQSGVPDFTLSPDWQADVPVDPSRWFTDSEIVGYAAAMGPNGPDQGGYSNTNYVLLGQLVERLDGTDLATALADRVTGPLGLTSTRLATEDEPGIDGLAGGWTSGDLDGIPLAGDPDTPYNSVISSGVSAGGVMSTTGDLAAFLTALFAGDLISTEALGQMTTIGDSGNGLGVFPVTLDSGRWGLGHNGWGGGYRSVMAINPINGDVVVVLTNNDELAPEEMLWGVALSS
jgi:D-alanyl-D-alanine carboxypeptidase